MFLLGEGEGALGLDTILFVYDGCMRRIIVVSTLTFRKVQQLTRLCTIGERSLSLETIYSFTDPSTSVLSISMKKSHGHLIPFFLPFSPPFESVEC